MAETTSLGTLADLASRTGAVGQTFGLVQLQNGAPLRVRFETKLGFKMVKFLRSIEFIDDYHKVGGLGGVREDRQEFDMGAEI